MGWVTLRLNFRLKGYISRQNLWAVRWGNGYTTTCRWKFSHKLCSKLYLIEIKFYFKKTKRSLFEPPVWGLRGNIGNICTPSIVRWKGRRRIAIRHNYAARHIMSADFYTSPGFFFFRPLISELAERNSIKIGHVLGSNFDLKTHVQNLAYPLPPTNRGPKAAFFGRLRNFNGRYLQNETWYRQPVKCVDNYKGSPRSSQNIMNFGPQTA